VKEKDFYLVLGVPRGATADGIREAFRDLAMRYHPDRIGPSGTERFQQIAEAYTTLSDPEKRRRYNRWLDDRDVPTVEPEVEPAEPLVPEPVSLFRDFHRFGPSREEIHRRFRSNFEPLGGSKGERIEPLNVELILTPEEVARGGSLPIAVPVFRSCPLCDGTGDDWGFACLLCSGNGMLEEEATVRLHIEPGVRDNSVYELPISGLGIHNFYLRVILRISR
jgi:DnaJ-class molecular chaperone